VSRFTLVPDAISKDTVACLRALLRLAEEGQLIGIAFAAMLKKSRNRKTAIVNTAGECHKSRIFTRGMVRDLDDFLRASNIDQIK
jgi:hypothetical protein